MSCINFLLQSCKFFSYIVMPSLFETVLYCPEWLVQSALYPIQYREGECWLRSLLHPRSPYQKLNNTYMTKLC